MSITAFLDQGDINFGTQPVQQAPSDFGRIVSLGFRNTRDNFNSDSRDRLIMEERQKRIDMAEEILGERITISDAKLADLATEGLGFVGRGGGESPLNKKVDRLIDQRIDKLKANDPERFASIPTMDQVVENARKRANLSRREFEAASRRATPFSRTFGSLVGGFGAAATDPFNISASIAGGLAVGKTVLKFALLEAGANAGVEAAIQPNIIQWQKELGQEYGFNDALQNIGFAALFGGAFGAVVKGTKPAASALFRKMSEIPTLTKRSKVAASSMANAAHVRENIPVTRNVRAADQRKHVESLAQAEDSFRRGTPLEPDTLKVSQADFLNADTTIRPGDTQIKRTQLEELQRFQDKSPPEPARVRDTDIADNEPKFSTETLPQQVLDKAQKPGILRARDFEPEELKMLKSAGIEPNNRGQIPKARLGMERTRRARAGEIQDVADKPRQHIEQFNRQTTENSIRQQDINAETMSLREAKEQVDRVLDENVSTNEVTEALIRANDSPDARAAELEAIRSLAESDPTLKITREDGSEISVRDLLDEFDEDDRVLREITTCGLG